MVGSKKSVGNLWEVPASLMHDERAVSSDSFLLAVATSAVVVETRKVQVGSACK